MRATMGTVRRGILSSGNAASGASSAIPRPSTPSSSPARRTWAWNWQGNVGVMADAYDKLIFELSSPGRVAWSLPEADVPEALQGAPITLITAGLLTLAFMGFASAS